MTRFRLLVLSVVALGAGLAVLPVVEVAAQTQIADSGKRVLLLRTGRVLEGRIREISTGWLVSRPTGHVVIPADQVQFEAPSLEDIYLRLRLEMRSPTAGTHLRLADWCLSQKLHPEAMRELRDALKLDPSNETARIMLDRIEQEVRRQTQPADDRSARPPSSVGVLRIGTQRSGDNVPEARSLAGLSRQTAEDFVTRIQPLLANKCGNARCHGTVAKNEFRLERVASRSRLRVERNLAAVLKFVDPNMPLGSRMLMPIDRSHGGRLVFSGSSGAAQAEILREWVQTAAAELRGTSRSRLKSQFAAANGEPRLISAGDGGQDGVGDAAIPATSGSRRDFPAATDGQYSEDPGRSTEDAPSNGNLTRFQKLLIEVEDAAEEVDVFDPGEFNRRYATAPTQ